MHIYSYNSYALVIGTLNIHDNTNLVSMYCIFCPANSTNILLTNPCKLNLNILLLKIFRIQTELN